MNSELRAVLKYQHLPFNPQEDHAKAEKLFPLVPSSSLLPIFFLVLIFPYLVVLVVASCPFFLPTFSFPISISLEKSKKLANLQEQGFRIWTTFHEQIK